MSLHKSRTSWNFKDFKKRSMYCKMAPEKVGAIFTSSKHQAGFTVISMNNQLKDSRTEVLQPRIYRRSCTRIGKKGRGTEKCAPTPTCWGWDARRMSWLQKSPLRSVEFQSHPRIPNPENRDQEEKPALHHTVKISGYSVHLEEEGFC